MVTAGWPRPRQGVQLLTMVLAMLIYLCSWKSEKASPYSTEQTQQQKWQSAGLRTHANAEKALKTHTDGTKTFKKKEKRKRALY